jgi:hypothetical protein
VANDPTISRINETPPIIAKIKITARRSIRTLWRAKKIYIQNFDINELFTIHNRYILFRKHY